MTIASGGTLGTGANSTSNSSYTFNTATNTLAAGDFAVLVSTSDNTSTADGDNNEHTSVSGGTGTWTKLGEYCNSNGAAAAGVTTSVWLFKATGTVSTGTTITLSFASNRTDKCCAFWKFTKAAGTNVILDPEPGTNPITSEVNAANGFGSSAFSGLSSVSRLYLRGAGKEANSTTALTVSASFTEITGTRSRNNASAVLVRGEFRINTSTGETSNPTLAVSGDTAGLFFALREATIHDATLSESVAVTEAPAPTMDVAAAASETAATVDAPAPTMSMDAAAAEAAGIASAETASSTGGSTITPVALPRVWAPRRQPVGPVQLNPAHPRARGLVFAYAHNDNPFAADWFARGRALPVSQFVSCRPGVGTARGAAVDMSLNDGSLKAILFGSAARSVLLGSEAEFTVAFWARWTVADGVNRYNALLQKGAAGTGNFDWVIGGSRYSFAAARAVWSVSSVSDFATATNVALNRWYRCLLVKSGSNAEWWLDGKQDVTTTSFPAPAADTSGRELMFGRNLTDSKNAFFGHAAGVMIWHRALTPQERVDDFVDCYAPFRQAPAHYWFGAAGGPTTHNATQAESVAVTSAQAATQDVAAAVAESVAATTAEAATQDSAQAASESVVLASTQAGTQDSTQSAAESVAITTAQAQDGAATVTVAEAAAIVSAQDAVQAATGAASESVAVTSAEAASASYAPAAAESVAVTSAESATQAATGSASEAVAIVSAEAATMATTQTVAEQAAVVSAEAQDGAVVMTVSESIGVASAQSVAVDVQAVVSESAALTTTQAALQDYSAAVAEAVAVASTQAVTAALAAGVSEALAAVDAAVAALAFAAGVSESLVVVDAASGSIIGLTVELPDGRTLRVWLELRTLTTEAEPRTLAVPAEPRTLAVEAEQRTLRVPAEPREGGVAPG